MTASKKKFACEINGRVALWPTAKEAYRHAKSFLLNHERQMEAFAERADGNCWKVYREQPGGSVHRHAVFGRRRGEGMREGDTPNPQNRSR